MRVMRRYDRAPGIHMVRRGSQPFCFDANREYIISDTAFHLDCGYPSTVCFEDGNIVTGQRLSPPFL